MVKEYIESYLNNHTEFTIVGIEYEDDASTLSLTEELTRTQVIEFELPAPDIAVDSSARFAKHEIVGGSTVRQRIGEDPIEVDISGVCREPTARKLDGLRDAKFGIILSRRLTGASLKVQFASVSTSPETSGGSVLMEDDDEFLYNFDLSCVEVTQ